MTRLVRFVSMISVAALAVAAVEACMSEDVIAVRNPPGDAGTDASTDASTDSGFDAGPNLASGCPGPVILPGASRLCSSSVAQQRFAGAVCGCFYGVQSNGDLHIDAFDSRTGPYDSLATNAGGDFLSNDSVILAGTTTITGSMIVEAPAGASFTGSGARLTVDGPIVVWAPFVDAAMQAIVIGKMDVSIGGATQLDTLDVSGVFHHPSSSPLMITNQIFRMGTVDEQIIPPDPCPCEIEVPFDLPGLIAASATENENASIGLSVDALANPSAQTTLALPCGRFHLSSITSGFPVAIDVTGHAAVFVDGDVDAVPLAISIAAGASLDLFIGGTMAVREPAQLGDPARPSALRIYVDGSTAIDVEPNASVAGNLFASSAAVTVPASYEWFGSLLAETLMLSGTVEVHDDSAIRAPEPCLVP